MCSPLYGTLLSIAVNPAILKKAQERGRKRYTCIRDVGMVQIAPDKMHTEKDKHLVWENVGVVEEKGLLRLI